MAVYTFDSTSVRDYSIVDNGGITSAAVVSQDLGTIDSTPTATQEYNEIVFTDVAYPYGKASISGSASVNQFTRNIPTETAEIKVVGIVTSNIVFHWTGSGTAFEISGGQELIVAPWTVSSGTLRNSFSRSVIGSGSLFDVGFAEEKISFDYNLSSDNIFNNIITYGSVGESVGNVLDFGYVYEAQYAGDYDYGLVNVTDDDFAANILFSVSGQSYEEFLPVYSEDGSGLFEVLGTAETEFKPNWRGRGGIFIFGGEGDSFTKPYIGSGNLFTISDGKDSITYDYNSDSVEYFNILDYGAITQSGLVSDYGYVYDASYAELDAGYIVNTQVNEPFGLFAISGEATTEYKPTFTSFGTGLFEVTGTAKAEFKPHWRGRGGIFVSGGESDSFTKPYIGSGNLFGISNGKDSVTYDYNTTSIESFDNVNYGLITQSGDTLDYGYVYDASYAEFDYGYVINTDEERPFGLFAFGGEAITEYKPTFTSFGTGTLVTSGSAETQFKPHWRGRGGIFVSGGESDSLTKPYVGSGKLFGIGNVEENIVYYYNESSVELYSDSTDYGSITQSGDTLDYGYVYDASYAEFDYGYVITIDEDRPFGLFAVTGQASTDYKPSFDTTGTGLFEISGAANTQFKPKWNGFGTIQLSGGERDSLTKPYIGSGNLFTIATAIESATYDYNESSIEIYGNLDYQLINNVPGVITDYGSISSSSYNEYDYGYVLTPYTDNPFGLFAVSGSAEVDYLPSLSQFGTGLFAVTGDAKTIFKPKWNGFGTIQLSGGERDSTVKSYVGSGDLFTIGEKIEKVTFEYNSSSVDLFYESDYQFISSAEDVQLDYGTITEQSAGGEIDYGTVINVVETRPYGSVSINGIGDTPRTIRLIGDGNLFGFDGASESFIAQTPENTVFYSFSGSAIEKNTENYVGTGAIYNYKGQSAPTDFRFMPWWRGYGEIILSGTSERQNIKRYVSRDGSLFAVNGSAEAFSAQTPENTVFYSFSGSAAEKNTENYVGDGSLFGFGGSVEAQTDSYTPVETLFKVYGSAIEKNTESYVGTGSISLYTNNVGFEWLNYRPTPRYVTVSGELYVNGSVEEAKTKAFEGSGSINISGSSDVTRTNKFFGTGSIFTFQGSSESRTIAIDTETGLFSVNGTGNDSYSRIYSASGRLFGFGSASESSAITVRTTGLFNVYGDSVNRYVPNWNGFGSINLSDQGDTSRSRDYIASGSLFGFRGGAESFSAQTPENTIVFNISGASTQSFSKGNYTATGSEFVYGSLQEKNTRSFYGSGTLFGFNSSAESKSVTFRAETSLYTIYGNSANSRTRIISGSGTLFTTRGGAESFSAQTPENTVLYVVSGTSENSKTRTYAGAGSFFGFGSASESSTISHKTETALYSVQGNSEERFIRGAYQSSGSLFGFGGGAESFSAQTPENTVLYVVSGNSSENSTRAYVGDIATYTLSGSTTEKSTRGAYQSSGSLFGFRGGAESFSAQTPENTALFVFDGTKKESFSKGNYSASGSLFGIGASAESSVNVVTTEPDLFKISGSATESFVKSTYNGSGLYEASGQSSVLITQSFAGSGSEIVSGGSFVLLTFGYTGSGTITAVGTGDFHAEYKTDATAAEFVFYGGTEGSRTIISVTNKLEINISGRSVDFVRLFTPPRKFGTII